MNSVANSKNNYLVSLNNTNFGVICFCDDNPLISRIVYENNPGNTTYRHYSQMRVSRLSYGRFRNLRTFKKFQV